MIPVTIRDADPERDGAACAAIYAPYVETTPISFEEQPPTASEVSVYVADDRCGIGIGRRLYEALFQRLRQQRFQVAFAGITLPNETRVAPHERLGFARVGIGPRIGWKRGSWHNVSWWQLELSPPGDDSPPEPLPPGPPPAPGYH
jgi:L-amino acid N-acyltransferase YncA